MKKVLFLESEKDQAKTIASFLKKAGGFDITFENNCIYDGEKGLYDIIIPSGALSTFHYVNKYGSLKIGELEYSPGNLVTYDKIEMLKIVDRLDIPIPQTFTLKSEINFFPIFYKSLREEGYNERGVIRTPQELENQKSTTVFYQEFIRTKGTFAVGFIADRGKMITTFAQEEKISYPYHGGSGVVLKKIEDKRLYDYTNRIVQEINYSGWGLAEYKYCDKRDDYVFMEVNAKFWASIEFTFINNPVFLNLLFGIEYPPKNINTVVYIDRVAASNLREILKSIPYMIACKWLTSQNVKSVLKKRFRGKNATTVA